MDHGLNDVATTIFQAALVEDRSGELLECLLDGGSATIDAHTGKLLILSAADLNQILGLKDGT